MLYSNWNKIFAWFPVTTVSGQRIWFKPVYKRKVSELRSMGNSIVSHTYYEYGTLFDMLKTM